jgi:hypothetical protein
VDKLSFNAFDDLPAYIQASDELQRPKQRELLMEFANLNDTPAAFARFRKLFPSIDNISLSELKAAILKDDSVDIRSNLELHEFLIYCRNALRYFWENPKITASAVQFHSLEAEKVQKARGLKSLVEVCAFNLSAWFNAKLNNDQDGWWRINPLGITRPKLDNFLGQVAWAVCRNCSRFAICSNPDCPARYYFWRRFDQKFCTAGACVRYANRIAANKYWERRGKQRRSMRQKVS